ncbi:MAG: ABC transporter permease subunit [Acidobacteria bacterium]|nr:ABC transporter permease subunit [Acidobacteriota bacterium]
MDEIRAAIGFSLWVAAASTALALASGVFFAVRGARVLWQVPLAMPHLTMAVVVLHLLAPSGLLARLLYSLGVIAAPGEFPDLVQDRWGAGIILVYWIKETPFFALLARTVLARLSGDYDAVAATLGAGPWQRFRYVTAPLLLPALGPAAVLVFGFVFASFDVAFLLGRTYPAMLSVVVQRYFVSDRETALMISAGMGLLSAALAALYVRWRRPT